MKYIIGLIIGLLVLTACGETPVPPANVTEPSNPFLNPGYHEITISNYMYSPKAITVYQGDRVKWINNMQIKKNIWIWGQEPSPLINPGKSWSYFFTDVGFFEYRDQYQQDMEGNVTVLPYEERPDVKARLAGTTNGP